MGLARRVVAVGQGFPSFPRDGSGLVVPSGKQGWSFSEPATLGRRERQAWRAEFLSVAFVFVFFIFPLGLPKRAFLSGNRSVSRTCPRVQSDGSSASKPRTSSQPTSEGSLGLGAWAWSQEEGMEMKL